MRSVIFATILIACGGSVNAPPAAQDSGAPLPQSYPVLAARMSLSDVAVFQGVKATIVKSGAVVETRNAPVIADRPALIRVYVTPLVDWKPMPLTAELHLSLGGKEIATLTDTKTITSASIDKDLQTTFDFSAAADQLPTDVEWSLSIRDTSVPKDRPEGAILFPEDGSTLLLDAQGQSSIRLKIVPIQYDADGSGRLPDTSDNQIALYRDTIFKMYPTSNVEISVRDPLPWNQKIEATGAGWDELLMALANVRASDAPPTDVYYIATFKPATSIQSFCSGGGCILGIAPLAGPNTVDGRIAMVLGYSGSGASTLLQELAHSMGRNHAPCGGAGGPDPKYPYPKGAIGVFGWDLFAKKLIDPASSARDFMGYCYPVWISDYTYDNLYTRIRWVNKTAKSEWKSGQPGQSMQVMSIDGAGRAHLGPVVHGSTIADEHTVTITYSDASGTAVEKRRGRWLPYDNIPGGMLLVPAGSTGASSARIDDLPQLPAFRWK